MRLKLEGWYAQQLIRLAEENNTTPTQIIVEYIKSTNSHKAQDAKENTNGKPNL